MVGALSADGQDGPCILRSAVRSDDSVCSRITLGIIVGRRSEGNNIGHEGIPRVQGDEERLATLGAWQRDLLTQGPLNVTAVRVRGGNRLAAVRARKRRVWLAVPRN